MAHRRCTIEVMKRLLMLLVALASALALGQTLDKTKHVGYLVWSSEGPHGHLEQALLDAMRADGYVEARTSSSSAAMSREMLTICAPRRASSRR